MRRPVKATEVLGEFHKLDEWLKSEEALFWLEGFMQVSARQYTERGTPYHFRTVYGEAQSAGQFQRDLVKDLFQSRIYQVTEEMTDLTSASYQNIRNELSGLSEWNLPFPYGWAWLDRQYIRMGDDDAEMSVRAVSWGLVPELPGVRIITWHKTSDLTKDWTAVQRDNWLLSHGGRHSLVYTHSNVVPFEQLIGPPQSGGDDIIRWVKVLWALMDSEISTEQHPGLKPYAMKRHRELFEGKKPEVTVILLRRLRPRAPGEPTGQHHMIDWSLGRIVVQGFHRHIRANYAPIPHHHAVPDSDKQNRTCRTCGNEITWVHAYLKGPDGLPIRNADQLWRLTR